MGLYKFTLTQADHMVAGGIRVSELVPCTYKLNDNQENIRNCSIRTIILRFVLEICV